MPELFNETFSIPTSRRPGRQVHELPDTFQASGLGGRSMTGTPPLEGVRILDFTRMLSGPFCTALLGDLGADVIKVETPNGGDDARHFAPRKGGESTYFMLVNRNKRSITLDLKSEDGRATAQRLARMSDVVVENFRPGVVQRLGIDYATLAEANPRLVYASISGFGQDGPFAQRAAYDIVAQAMGGMTSINGYSDGPPTRVGESLGDLAAGVYASWSILAALHARDRSGHGQHLDIAMVDSIFSLLVTALSDYLFTGNLPPRYGNSNPISAPLDSYRARDGDLIIAVANDALFSKLCDVIGKPELAADPRFATDPARKENEDALRVALEEWTATRTVDDAVTQLSDAAIPASPVWSIDQVVDSEHASHRGLVRHADHANVGTVPLVLQPVQFLGGARMPERAAPALGQHQAEVMADLASWEAGQR